MKRAEITTVVLTLLVLVCVGAVFAGSLNPTNAPASTMCTLDEIYGILTGTTPGTKIGLNNTNAPAPTMRTVDEVYQAALLVAGGGGGGGAGAFGVLKTGVTTSHTVGDDGYYQKGTAWPDPLFTVWTGSASNCVTDNRTGLMWVRNPSGTERSWSDALAYCEALDGSAGRGGYTDWRMPNIREMMTMTDYSYASGEGLLPAGHPFIGTAVSNGWWTSTTVPWASSLCWQYGNEALSLFGSGKTGSNYVWPVRGGN